MSILFCSECSKRFITGYLTGRTDTRQTIIVVLGQEGGSVIGFSAKGQRIIAVFRTAGHDLLT